MVTAVIAAFFYLRVILLMYSSSAGLAVGGDGDVVADGLSAPGGGAADAAAAVGAGAATATAVATVAAAAAVDEGVPITVAPAVAVAIAVCVAVTVLFGVWPAPVVNFAHHALLYSTSH